MELNKNEEKIRRIQKVEAMIIADKNRNKQEAELLINSLKNKDKKLRYKTLDAILHLSRSNKHKLKKEFLRLILFKSVSDDWEERYVAMYALSRFYRRNWNLQEFKEQFLNVFRLIQDSDGRVRIAARNALEHFRSNFLYFVWGEWKVDGAEVVTLWKESLYLLWEKIKATKKGKMQAYLVECIKILYQHDMDSYLDKKDFEKYSRIWDKVNELDEFYYESG